MNHYFSSATLGQCCLVFSSIKCTSLHHWTAMEPVLHQNRLRKPLRPQLSVIPWMGDELMSWLWLLLTSTCMHLLQLLAEGSTMNFPFLRGELFKGEQRNKGENICKIKLSLRVDVRVLRNKVIKNSWATVSPTSASPMKCLIIYWWTDWGEKRGRTQTSQVDDNGYKKMNNAMRWERNKSLIDWNTSSSPYSCLLCLGLSIHIALHRLFDKILFNHWQQVSQFAK